jgi:ketosteroid isomerase-like protein
MNEENKQIMTAIMGELSRGNTAPFANAMTEDFTWRVMGDSQVGKWRLVYEGKERVRKDLFAPLMAQYADHFTSTPNHIFADGEHVIVETEGAVTTKAGKRYCNKYCMVIRMAGGKMREVREYFDSALADAVLEPLPS